MLMLIMTICLWTISILMYISNRKSKNELIMVLNIFIFICGIPGLTNVWATNKNLWVDLFGIDIETVCLIQAILGSIPHYMGVYLALMYGLICSELIKTKKNKYIVYFVCYIPVILFHIFLPYKTPGQMSESERISFFVILSIYSLIYHIISFSLIYYRWQKEKNTHRRTYWILTIILTVPFMFSSLMFNYILRIFTTVNTGNIFIYIVPIQFVLFVYFTFKKDGALGLILKVENYKLSITKVFDYISDSIVILDENLKIIEINKSFYTHFGKVQTHDIDTLIKKSKLKAYEDKILNAINAKSNEIIHLEFDKDNKFYALEIIILIKNDIFEGISILIKDMTEYNKNIQLLKQNQIQMVEKEKLSAFSHLISGLAHNLKTPLMSSLGGIAILKKQTKKLDDDKYKDDETIQKVIKMQTKHENMIQHNISNVSKSIKFIQNQSESDDESNLSIEKIIKEVEFFLSFELPKNNCILKININNINESKSKLSIDDAIVQVLNNLIINSMQSYNDIKSENIKNIIELNIYSENENIIFTVKDYGCGIPEDIQTRIFNKMTTTKGNEGSGLGLYITNIIVKAKLKGSISFESSPKGTTFSIMIPIS